MEEKEINSLPSSSREESSTDDMNTNKLAKSFNKNLREDMSDREIVKFIFYNSFFSILCKVLITINDSITISFLGHLNGYKLSPFFIASLIQNVGFKGIGYGLTTTANMLASRYFGKGEMYKVGSSINQGKIVVFVYSLICLLITFLGKDLFAYLFPNVDIEIVQTYLIHNSLTIVLDFQITMQLIYLNSQNNFVYPAILDSMSTLTQYLIFKIVFSIYSDEIISSDKTTFIITAWCLNLFSFLQYSYYTLFIYIYKPSLSTNLCFDRNSLKVKNYLSQSIYFVFFFISHFLGGEQLGVLIRNYYGKDSNHFDALQIAQKVYFILQKFSMGFSFMILNVAGNLITRKFYNLLRRIIKIFFVVSFAILFLSVILVEIFADYIAQIYTNKPELIELIPTYMRIIALVMIPFHLENILQSILTGHKKQKSPSYFSIGVTVIGGLGFGFLFIYGFDLGVKGVFITMFILESLLSFVNIMFYFKLKINTNTEEARNSLL